MERVKRAKEVKVLAKRKERVWLKVKGQERQRAKGREKVYLKRNDIFKVLNSITLSMYL